MENKMSNTLIELTLNGNKIEDSNGNKVAAVLLGKPRLVKRTYDVCFPFGPSMKCMEEYVNKKDLPKGTNSFIILKNVKEKSYGESGYVVSKVQFCRETYNETTSPMLKELKTLKRGDYIEASGLYYKVLEVKNSGLVLSDTFLRGGRARGRYFSSFYSEAARIDWNYWNIIRKNAKGAKGIEKRMN